MTNQDPPLSPIDQAFLTRDPDAGQLILVRHGQQQWPDPETSTTGDWVDPPLSETGRRQAASVGEYLAGEPISAVYSSRLLRAHDTGLAVAGHHGHDVEIIDELAEFHLFGELDPTTRAVEVLGSLRLEGIRRRFAQTRRWDVYPYSESALSFRRRVGYAVEGIMAEHPGETVVVACHGGVINVVVAEIIGIEIDFVFRPGHASVHRIRFNDHRRVIESLNEHAFLRAGDLLTY
ncbi:MAG: histidine phosphatase family protein [Acidimicrobiales bacterium]